MNRAERREMARRLKAQGREMVVLRGGPMDGWIVKPDAPALRPAWHETWPVATAAMHAPGRYQVRSGEATAVWTVLD